MNAKEKSMNLFYMFDPHRLGASLLAAGPVLMQLGGTKGTWWVGMVFTTLGPLLMAVKKRG